jgi:NADH-quinone oxidoreductase subunit C
MLINTNKNDLLKTLNDKKAEGFTYLSKITAVDYIDHIDVIYFISNFERHEDEIIKVRISSDEAWVPTIINVFSAADWYERELSEMFGIKIKGRTTKRLLLEKWDGKIPPLRKSFVWGSKYDSSG